jgi:hypothetical protein
MIFDVIAFIATIAMMAASGRIALLNTPTQEKPE